MPDLQIYMLGAFHVFYDGKPVSTLRSARLQSLLGYLVLNHAAPLPRRDLAFLLWPDSTESQSHTNLRKLLHELRTLLPAVDTFVLIDRTSVQWKNDAPFTLDAAEFEQTANRASTTPELQAAVELYRGDLMPGCYDDWIVPPREHLRQLLIDTLERLVTQLESQRDYHAAIQYTQRLMEQEPLREETCLRLMRLYLLVGNRTGALRTYHVSVTALQRELGIEPSPVLRETYRQLLNMDVSLSPQPSAVPRLVGRNREWAELQAAWRTAAEGQPRWVLLTGEAGIGKTRLAEEFIEWGKRQGISTASTSRTEAESTVAFAPVAAWLRSLSLPPLDESLLSEIVRLVPEIRNTHPHLANPPPLTAPGERHRFAQALVHTILTVQPLVLFLDDLQWCDIETLEWLHFLFHSEPQARLLVVSALRYADLGPAHPVASFLPTLRAEGTLTEIELSRLSESESKLLVASAIEGEPDPALVARLLKETEGNPLFVLEMVRSNLVASVDGAMSIPPTIQGVLESRLAQLSPTALQLVDVAAVISHAFTSTFLARVIGVNEEELVRGLDELWQKRIIREHGVDAYDFSHHLYRQMAYARLSPPRRRLLHRHVAQALEATYSTSADGISGEIAAHFEKGSEPEKAIQYYLRAGDAARSLHANEAATNYYQHVLSLLPQKEPLT